MGPRGVPTYPLGIAERWHRNLPSWQRNATPGARGPRRYILLGRCNLLLRSVVSSRSPRVTHSFHYAGAPYKYLYGGAPYKSPKIAENRAACGGCGSLAVRAADTYRQKSLNCQEKRRLLRISEVQPDLRGSLIVLRTVNSSCTGPARAPLWWPKYRVI